MTGDEAREGRYWGNPLDSQDIGSRWEDSEGDMVEVNCEAGSSSYARDSAHVARRDSQEWHAADTNHGESDYVSESHDSDEDEDPRQGDCAESHWNSHHEDDHYRSNGGIVHAQDPEDSVDEYAHIDEDIVALSRPNGHHVEKGMWREEAYVDAQPNGSALRRDEDDLNQQHHSSRHLSNGHASHLMGASSPQHRARQHSQSPDKANNTHIIRGMKGHMEWPRNNIDVVMRSKLLESNLERQQLRHR